MRRKAFDRLLQAAVERPAIGLLATAICCAIAAALIVDPRTGEPRIFLDPTLDSLLPRGDEGRIHYDRIKALLDGGETILIGLAEEDVFTRDSLESIRRISTRIEALEEVHHVSSLATALNIRSEGGSLRIEPFYEAVPADADDLADLRRRALTDPIYAGNLVTRDGRLAVIAVQLLDLPELTLLASGVDGRIAEIAREEAGAADVWITGGPHIKAELVHLMLRDLLLVIPIATALMALVAFLAFRTVRGVTIPLLTVGIAILWTVAFMAVCYGNLNQVTVAAPPILLVIGFAYSIHVLSAYYDLLRGGAEGRSAVLAAMRRVAVPVVFTGITTVAGFLALTTSPLDAISQFGVFCAVGVTFTMLVTLTFTPALMQALPAPTSVRMRLEDDRVDRWLEALARFDLRRRRPIIVLWGVVAVLALVGMGRIEIGTDLVRNFKRSNTVRQDFDRLNHAIGGANGFQITVETSVTDAFREPENLRALDELQRWLEAQPEIGGTTSLVDYIEVIHQGLQDGEPEQLRVPETKELVSQLLVIGDNEEMYRYVDSDFGLASIAVRTTAMDSADVMALVGRIEKRLTQLPHHLVPTVTGNAVLISRTMDEIAQGQASSLAIAFLAIYAILVVLFTSFRVGFIALIPNALPVLIYFGILGWTGVTLNTTTGLVACLVVGIAVDDTIHLLAHFNAAAKRHADEFRGLVGSMRSVGRPVTYTTLALCLGFLCLLASSMNGQIDFGWLAALTLAIAWLVDVTFTPALAGRMRIVTLWDVLTLDLGENPRKSIPLFAGLREAEARIAALMASIHELPRGTQIFKEGELGDEMYVVLEGHLVASISTEAGELRLSEQGRGDVVGEVALFQGRRTADVHATTPVRLLRFTLADLQRLKRRYPRIGAQLYENLSHVLAGRLTSLTRHVRER